MIKEINEILKRVIITEKDNRETYFEHIFYEFSMFFSTAYLIAWLSKGIIHLDPSISNALLESYRMHLRCVSGFFLKKSITSKNPNKYGDDIFVHTILNDDVYTDEDYHQLSPEANHGINKCTGHLSKSRVKKSVELQKAIFENDDFLTQSENIRRFLGKLSEKSIQNEFVYELNNPKLQEKLAELEGRFQ